MRSMMKRSMVTLAAAGALLMAGTGAASAAPVDAQAAPDSATTQAAGDDALGDLVATLSEPAVYLLKFLDGAAAGLPIPSIP